MGDAGKYQCRLTTAGRSRPAECTIGRDSVHFTADGEQLSIDFADLQDIRLINYHLTLATSGGAYELAELGRDTEPFFENLWNAFTTRSKEALFAECEPLYKGEGDYAYTETDGSQHGIAKIELLPDSLVLSPHDRMARRIPLCFVQKIIAENFGITTTLDTGDTYTIRRIGRDTEAVFEKICATSNKVRKEWQEAHRDLEEHIQERLGDRDDEYRHITSLGCKMIAGLYRLNGDGFWFAGLKDGRAAVELVTQEQSATYMYTYGNSDEDFEHCLRHAMESAGLHREVIFADLSDKPLYRMTVERSYHLRFLREHNTKRIIHNQSWAKNLSEFMG